jgi:hypothetical protein
LLRLLELPLAAGELRLSLLARLCQPRQFALGGGDLRLQIGELAGRLPQLLQFPGELRARRFAAPELGTFCRSPPDNADQGD